MGFGEKRKLTENNRLYWTTHAITLHNRLRTGEWDGTGRGNARPVSWLPTVQEVVMLGGEVGKSGEYADSVWAVSGPGRMRRLHVDFGKWKTMVNRTTRDQGGVNRGKANRLRALAVITVAVGAVATVVVSYYGSPAAGALVASLAAAGASALVKAADEADAQLAAQQGSTAGTGKGRALAQAAVSAAGAIESAAVGDDEQAASAASAVHAVADELEGLTNPPDGAPMSSEWRKRAAAFWAMSAEQQKALLAALGNAAVEAGMSSEQVRAYLEGVGRILVALRPA